MSADAGKRAAGRAAVIHVRSGMRLGLGTGSTAFYAVEAIGERWQAGTLRDVVVVPTSEQTEAQARSYGLPIRDLSEVLALDVVIDGADEIDPAMNLVKGRGGALLREKIVARASALMVVVADASKVVRRLGGVRLPVEVEPFGWKVTETQLASLGCDARLRLTAAGAPARTDGGHFTIDCQFDGIDDPFELESAIKRFPGALECGLFLGLARHVLIGSAEGVLHMRADGSLAPLEDA